ncbi:MAG TPA: LysR family transcriptional regulator [Longimicrobium sp.]
MDFRHLRYFVAIAEEGTFTRAARRLYIAQPALSKQIHDLEEEIGVRLLVRSARGAALTAPGAELLEHARSLLKAEEVARTRIRGLAATRAPAEGVLPLRAKSKAAHTDPYERGRAVA